VAYFKVVSCHLVGGTMENHERSERRKQADSNRIISVHVNGLIMVISACGLSRYIK
jgi:hypothetical protein